MTGLPLQNLKQDLKDQILNIKDISDELIIRIHLAFINGYTASLIKYSEDTKKELGNNPYFDYYEIRLCITQTGEFVKGIFVEPDEDCMIRYYEESEVIELLEKIASLPPASVVENKLT